MSIYSLCRKTAARLGAMKPQASAPGGRPLPDALRFGAWKDMQLEIWEQRPCKPAREHGIGGAA